MAQGVSINDLQFAGSINPSGHTVIQRLIVKDQDMVIDVRGSADIFEKAFKLKDVVKANILFSGQNINPKQFLQSVQIKKKMIVCLQAGRAIARLQYPH